MAADMNTVNLVGRCARTPELKSSGTSSVLKIRLAFTTQRKVRDVWEDQPNYVDVTTFGRRAEALAGLLDKGDRIGITGRLAWREWESKDGKRQSIEVLADDVQPGDLPIAPAPVQPVPDATDDIPF
jgi:single-strand DNA-binding protein